MPHLKRWVVVALFTLLLVMLRVGWSSRVALWEGQNWLAQGDRVGAARSFESSTHMYLPGIPWPQTAMAQLISLAEAAETEGRSQDALLLWSQVRSSSLSTRWIWTPWSEERLLADTHLATLVSARSKNWPDPASDPVSRQQQVQAAFAFEPRPRLVWSMTGLLAFMGALVGVGGLILRGFDVNGTPRQGGVKHWAGVVVVSITVWMCSMWMA